MSLNIVNRTWGDSDFATISALQTTMQLIEANLLAAGLVRYPVTNDTDYTAIPAGCIPNKATAGLVNGTTMSRCYEINDAWSATVPLYLQFNYIVYKNGVSNSSLGIRFQVNVSYDMPSSGVIAGPYTTAITFVPATIVNYGGNALANILYSGTSSPTVSSRDSANGLFAHSLAHATLIGTETGSSNFFNSSARHGMGAFSVARLKKANGVVDPARCVVMGVRTLMGNGAGAIYSNSNEASAATNYPNWRPVRSYLNRTWAAGLYADNLKGSAHWVGDVASSTVDGSVLPQMQPCFYHDNGTVIPDYNVTMYWGDNFATTPLNGAVIVANDGLADYKYMLLGYCHMESAENASGKVHWAIKLEPN